MDKKRGGEGEDIRKDEEDDKGNNNYDGEGDPAAPVIPGAVTARTVPISVLAPMITHVSVSCLLLIWNLFHSIQDRMTAAVGLNSHATVL